MRNQTTQHRWLGSALLTGAAVIAAAEGVSGQSLFLRQPEVILDANGEIDDLAALRGVSYTLVEPPPPRAYQVHDLIYIIIDENSQTVTQANTQMQKNIVRQTEIAALVDLLQLLETRLEDGDTDLDLIDLQSRNQFQAQGNYQRRDQVTARITAEVIDVKPNGTMVLQARKTVNTDEERRSILLSGVARREDVTAQNTLLSSQMADLQVSIQNAGALRRNSSKGFLTRVIDAVFNF